MGRSEHKDCGLVGRLVQRVGSTVGFATEVRAHMMARKAASQSIQARPRQVKPIDHRSNIYTAGEETPAYHEFGPIRTPTDSQVVFSESKSPVVDQTFHLQALPYPVILPQRRPNDKSRGFLRAYAPDLGTYKGIDETTFLAFLKEFHKSSQASGIFTVINIAAFGVGFAPSIVASVTAMAVQQASAAVAQAQGQNRTNSCLDKVNRELFHPRNLHCMILTFVPEARQHTVLDVNTENDAPVQSPSLSSLAAQTSRMKPTVSRHWDGATDGKLALPQAAHLVIPAQGQDLMSNAGLDWSDNGTQPGSPQQQSAWKSTGKFLADYKDRRAQAKFAAQHGANSQLAVPGAMDPRRFASRWSDPNNPLYSGNSLGVITGWGSPASSEDITSQKHQKRHRRHEPLEVEGSSSWESSRSRSGLLGGARSMMQQNLLYLLIAEIPSPEEISALTGET